LRAAGGVASEAVLRPPRDDRLVAGVGADRPELRRPRSARLLLPRELVDLARHLDPREDAAGRARPPRRVLSSLMHGLPTGTVTLLFADIERSTALLLELGPQQYGDALAEYQRVVRRAIESHGGAEVDTEGDTFFAAFQTAGQAVAGAAQAQAALA